MTFLGKFRKKAGNVCLFIAIGCCVLLLSNSIGAMWQYFFATNQTPEIGCVEGSSLCAEEYKNYCQNMLHKYRGKELTEGMQMYLKQRGWDELIKDKLYDKELKQLDITVSNEELVDMVQGEHIDATLEAVFKDPNTGYFDKQKLLDYLDRVGKSQQGRDGWHQYEKHLRDKRALHKFHQLMAKSNFVTTLEKAHKKKHAQMLCDVAYIYIPFTGVSDDLATFTEQQLQNYLEHHRVHYTRPTDSMVIQYVAFPIQPDEKDKASFQRELDSLTAQFSIATDPYYFAKYHTDGNNIHARLECDATLLPTALVAIKHTLQKGMVVGPVMEGERHMLYKVVDVLQKSDKDITYQIAVIEKKASISSRTRNKWYNHVKRFITSVKSVADFKALAEQEGVMVHQEENITPIDDSIGAYTAARKVVRWLYTQAKVGEISPIFDLGDVYIVAVMTEKIKKGMLPSLYSPSVYPSVYRKVLNEAKAKIVLTKLHQIQAPTLLDIAKSYDDQIEVKNVTGLKFFKNEDQQLDKAKVFVGSCFGLTPGTISNPIIDPVGGGVFMAYVKDHYQSIEPSEAPTDGLSEDQNIVMMQYYVTRSMEELADITDKRYNAE